MGRYFQHGLFPLTDFEVVAAFADVPESTFRFHSSGGVHLIATTAQCINTTAGNSPFQTKLLLDGVGITLSNTLNYVPANLLEVVRSIFLREIPEGDHTLVMRAAGADAVGDVLSGLSGAITVIEFPAWEASDRVESVL